MKLSEFIADFPADPAKTPWDIIYNIQEIIEQMIGDLGDDFNIKNGIAIHKTASIEKGVTLNAPIIIHANCKIGANSYFREGVFLSKSVKIGPGCEIKSSIICSNSATAHLNYIGNSLIGSGVNFEAGAIAANHYNERKEKIITVRYQGELLDTGLVKFGSIVGDNSKIGANAVLSPGTLLAKNSVVKRLELVDQQ